MFEDLLGEKHLYQCRLGLLRDDLRLEYATDPITHMCIEYYLRGQCTLEDALVKTIKTYREKLQELIKERMNDPKSSW